MVELVGGLFMYDLASLFVLLPCFAGTLVSTCVGSCGIRLMLAKHFGITQISVGVKTVLFKIENLLLTTHLTNWYS